MITNTIDLESILQKVNALTGQLQLSNPKLSVDCAKIGDDLISLMEKPKLENEAEKKQFSKPIKSE